LAGMDPQQAWDWTISKLGSTWAWVQAFADSHLNYAPLMTTTVALGAGCIALYAVHVQRRIARRRAATDFFLKTEMDDALLTRYNDFESKVAVLNAAMAPTTKMSELAVMPDWPYIRSYLNIHELIAVGIRLKVFDEKVCYHYWSAVLVGHYHEAKEIIAVARKEPEDSGAYLEMLRLKGKWERKIRLWRWWQGLPTDRFTRAVVLPSTPMSAPAAPTSPPDPAAPTPPTDTAAPTPPPDERLA
jgi:hypothetical protein